MFVDRQTDKLTKRHTHQNTHNMYQLSNYARRERQRPRRRRRELVQATACTSQCLCCSPFLYHVTYTHVHHAVTCQTM